MVLLIVMFVVMQAEACRYTIREIGYSNLYLEEYQLVLQADSLEHSNLINNFKSIAFAYVLNANVSYKFVQKEISEANLLFQSKEGKEIYSATITNTDEIINSINKCLSSSLRRQLIDAMGKSFAFILYFEGKEKNSKEYTDLIEDAIERFNQISPNLDKAVTEEIKVVKIAYSAREREGVVLRSLGVPESNQSPLLALIYGRGRLSGPPLIEQEITVKSIFNKLVIIGTDCECGINLSPLLERALPLSWTKEVRQETTKMLGFDTDNPMILVEMSQILEKGSANGQEYQAFMSSEIFKMKKNVTSVEHKENNSGNDILVTRVFIIALVFALGNLILGMLIYHRKR